MIGKKDTCLQDRDQQEKIFEMFTQIRGTIESGHTGLGIGLTLVRQLVELHGGTVSAESEGAGQGATLTVLLPVKEDSDIEASRVSDPLVAAHPEARGLYEEDDLPLTGLQILVVDDDLDALQMLKVALTGSGADVKTAMSAAEGLSALLIYKPDVLVSDIAMPCEDGYALIKKVRSLPAEEGGTIPAVAVTALARDADRARALEMGFQMFVPKPVEPVELIAAIADLADQTKPLPARL